MATHEATGEFYIKPSKWPGRYIVINPNGKVWGHRQDEASGIRTAAALNKKWRQVLMLDRRVKA